jgi:hypothetical protein
MMASRGYELRITEAEYLELMAELEACRLDWPKIYRLRAEVDAIQRERERSRRRLLGLTQPAPVAIDPGPFKRVPGRKVRRRHRRAA